MNGVSRLLRSAAERVSRGVVVRRRLPTRFGAPRIYVSPDSALRLLLPDSERWDPLLFNLVDELVVPGDIVWDVGANVGLFTFSAAVRAGREAEVVAIEADEWLVGLLRRSALIQPTTSARVDVLCAAAADALGIAKFNIAGRGRAASFLASTEVGGDRGLARASRSVVTLSLDWLAERRPAPRIIKIDVEGAEAAVLRGATNILAKSRPTVVCEVTAERSAEVSSVLRAAGYAILDASSPRGERRRLESAPWDTLAIPDERFAQMLTAEDTP